MKKLEKLVWDFAAIVAEAPIVTSVSVDEANVSFGILGVDERGAYTTTCDVPVAAVEAMGITAESAAETTVREFARMYVNPPKRKAGG